MRIVGLEEHYLTDDVAAAWSRLGEGLVDPMAAFPADMAADVDRKLRSFGDERTALMDAVGVDQHVISLTTPGLFDLDESEAVALQSATNDQVADAVRGASDRMQAFATLAPQRPEAAAAELDRAVRQLGFHGAMIFSRVRDEPIDSPRFWPIFEAAEALRAPLYLHPQVAPAAVRQAYYRGFGDAVEMGLATYAIGWHYDTGVEFLRLTLAGVFDRFPDLQIILGHWGEVLAFYVERADRIGPAGGLDRSVTDYLTDNAYLTPAGMLSRRYLGWARDVMPIERLMFATDYPYVPLDDGAARTFLDGSDLSEADRIAVASGNWDRLVAGIRR
ncbi:amidohydrolase family protein [uncultured Williamsia sp.]|uniref:amidohydrolase family protein n=1 Tax=uncultured Williamsia sp. TaxID=259311 RepID=UPI00260C3F77|nr:amidohydrolase family protein [uncultured Williamsia sp.]